MSQIKLCFIVYRRWKSCFKKRCLKQGNGRFGDHQLETISMLVVVTKFKLLDYIFDS